MVDDIAEALERSFDDQPRVAAVLLFGSHARGRARADSDVDVAVMLDPPCSRDEEYEIRKSLLGAMVRNLAADRLDLVLLDLAPMPLAFQVLRDGRVILDRRPELLHRKRVRIYGMHADYEPVERLFRKATRDRAMRASAEEPGG